ncbi:hypothetical protein FRB97_003898, partial [Tulasnella sp. 331]
MFKYKETTKRKSAKGKEKEPEAEPSASLKVSKKVADPKKKRDSKGQYMAMKIVYPDGYIYLNMEDIMEVCHKKALK